MGHLMVPLKSRNQSSMGSPMVRMLDVTFQCNQSVWGKKAFDEGGLCELCKCPPNQGWLVGRSHSYARTVLIMLGQKSLNWRHSLLTLTHDLVFLASALVT